MGRFVLEDQPRFKFEDPAVESSQRFVLDTPKQKAAEKSSSFLKDYAKDVLGKTSRVAGVGLGVLNSPLAMAWGAANAQNINPEEYKKLPYWKQELYSLGKGFESAWESISKEGRWGTLYGKYFEDTTGDTIEGALPEGLKWAAPTVETLANIISDPLIGVGAAKGILRSAMSPGAKTFKKTLPKGLIGELEKFDQLQASEKKILTDKLQGILENRKDYMKWWQDTLEAQEGAKARKGQPLLKPGQRLDPDLTAPRSAMAGQPKVGISDLLEEAVPPPEQFSRLSGIAETRPKPSIAKFKRERAVSEFNLSRVESGLDPIKLEDVEKAAKIRTSNRLDEINEFRKSKGLDEIPKSKFKAAKFSTTQRSTAGLVYGIEEDEEGNIGYNVKKGLAGALVVAGGVGAINTKRAKQFAQTMAQNPNWAKVAGSIGKKDKSFEFAGLFSRANTKLFDRFSKLKKTSPSTYDEARIYSSHKDVAKQKFSKLEDIFKPVRDDEVITTHYITAHRNLTRARHPKGILNPDDITAREALDSIKEMENHYLVSGKNPQVLKDVLQGFQDWTHESILKPSLDSGVISQKAYNEIIKNNEWYATFEILDRLPKDVSKIPSGLTGEYFSVGNQDIVKAMSGTTKKITDPVESTIKKFTRAQSTFARNKVASTFVDDPQAQSLFRPIASSAKEMKMMRQQGKDPVLAGHWDKTKDTIARFKDGHVEKYLTDKVYADAMKQLTPWQAPKVVQSINAIFRKSATTVYVPFTISNAMRDGLMAYTTAPVNKALRPDKFVGDWARGFWEGAKHEFLGKSNIANEYIGHGGGFGYVGNLRQSSKAKAQLFKKGIAGKTVDIIKSPLDLIEKVSAVIELAPRLGTYNRALKSGFSGKDAALMARQSTIDFNRGGTWTKAVNQWVPFLNARVQGRVTVANALKNSPKDTLAKTFTSVVVPGMTAYAWNRYYYSDLYDDIPEYIKQNYFTMIYGTDKDQHGKTVPKYFVISKGDLGQMAFNPIEFGMDSISKKNPEAIQNFAVNWLSDLSPVEFSREGDFSKSKAAGSLLPPVIKGFAEDWANLKFYTGQEIVPYYMGKSKPPELQYKENTPETYKWLGKKIGIAPLRLQNFASNILAGYGREGLDPSAMARGLTGRIVKTRGGEKQNQAWKVIADIEQGYSYTRAHAQELIEAGERPAALKLIREWNQGFREQLKEYNKKFKKYNYHDRGGIRSSYTFSPEKIKNLLKKRGDKRSPLERKIRRK